MRSIRRHGFGLLITAVFVGVPCVATAATVSVKVRQIPNAGKIKNATISLAPAPARTTAEWAVVTPRVTVDSSQSGKSLEPVGLLSLGLNGTTAAVATSQTMKIPVAGYPAEIVHDGDRDWAWDGSVVSIDASGTVANAGVVYGGVGFVAGPSNTLYTTDDGGLTYRCAASIPADCGTVSSLQAYRYNATGGPDALAVAGGRVWAVLKTPPAGGLLEFSSTPGGPIRGPFVRGRLEGDPGDALIGDGNVVYAAAVVDPKAKSFDAIDRISSRSPSSPPTIYASRAGMPVNAQVKGMTVGPGGNIFFEDSGTGKVGVLNVSSGRIREIGLPPGYRLPGPGNSTTDTIAPGPRGSNTLFVAVHNRTGAPAVAELRFGG